ncbi:MAG: universal stress protein [Hyphomicrobiales bacterium]|nr:universal stress protein [Hyphomicrobiales bacterium]
MARLRHLDVEERTRGAGMTSPIRSIVHPTDFSDLSGAAFAHALAIALAGRCRLHLLHVDQPGAKTAEFPHVQRLLAQWGRGLESDSAAATAERLGVVVDNVRLSGQDAIGSITEFLQEHPSDLVVLATHGREGLEHLLKGSVSESVLRRSAVPTLFIARGARGFIDQINGDVGLRRVLVPVDLSPEPGRALAMVHRLSRLVAGTDVEVQLLHVGRSAPPIAAAAQRHLPPVILRSGNVVGTIVDTAIELEADLIGMPTAGHHGILDALRGSTTERVIRHAPCPVLALPTG